MRKVLNNSEGGHMKVQAVEAVKDKKVCFFVLNGEIDEEQFQAVEKKLKDMIQAGEFNVIIDLSRVNHINYKSLDGLLNISRNSRISVAISNSSMCHPTSMIYSGSTDFIRSRYSRQNEPR